MVQFVDFYFIFYFLHVSYSIIFFSYLLPLTSPVESVNEGTSRTFLPVQHHASFSPGRHRGDGGRIGIPFPGIPAPKESRLSTLERPFHRKGLFVSRRTSDGQCSFIQYQKRPPYLLLFSPPNSKRELIIGYWKIPPFLFQALFMQQYQYRHLCQGNHCF